MSEINIAFRIGTLAKSHEIGKNETPDYLNEKAKSKFPVIEKELAQLGVQIPEEITVGQFIVLSASAAIEVIIDSAGLYPHDQETVKDSLSKFALVIRPHEPDIIGVETPLLYGMVYGPQLEQKQIEPYIGAWTGLPWYISLNPNRLYYTYESGQLSLNAGNLFAIEANEWTECGYQYLDKLAINLDKFSSIQ